MREGEIERRSINNMYEQVYNVGVVSMFQSPNPHKPVNPVECPSAIYLLQYSCRSSAQQTDQVMHPTMGHTCMLHSDIHYRSSQMSTSW